MSFVREITGKRGKKYQGWARVTGYKPKCKTFLKEQEARHWADAIEISMKNGTYKEDDSIESLAGTQDIRTVGDLITYFQTNEAPDRYANPAQYAHMYDWWRSKIGSVALSNLDALKLSQCKKVLSQEAPTKPYKGRTKKGNSTINKYLMSLSAILTYAVKELHLLEVNPMQNVTKEKKPKGRVRFLSEDELKALLPACEKHSEQMHIFVLITLSTGARYSEVLYLKTENLDFKNETFHFIDTKNGEDRGVPAYKDVFAKLKEYLKKNNITSGFIFLKKQKGGKTNFPYLRGAFAEIVKELKIEDFCFHDLRHTAASYLAMNGASLLDIAEILGHKTLNMVKRYAHLTQKHTSAVINKMAANMLNA